MVTAFRAPDRAACPPARILAVVAAFHENHYWQQRDRSRQSLFQSLSGQNPTLYGPARLVENGKVEMWRGGCRLDISVSAPFVWRCLSGSAMTQIPHSAHRTGHADHPHPALGQDFTLKREIASRRQPHTEFIDHFILGTDAAITRGRSLDVTPRARWPNQLGTRVYRLVEQLKLQDA